MFLQVNAQTEIPEGFKKGTIMLADNSSVTGYMRMANFVMQLISAPINICLKIANHIWRNNCSPINFTGSTAISL
jgi:hypothetical protein